MICKGHMENLCHPEGVKEFASLYCYLHEFTSISHSLFSGFMCDFDEVVSEGRLINYRHKELKYAPL